MIVINKLKMLFPKNKTAIFAGLFMYLVAISIGLITTNTSSRSYVVPIRFIAIVVSVFCTLFVAIGEKNKNDWMFPIIVYASLLGLGMYLSLASDSFSVVKDVLLVDVSVTILGLIILSISIKNGVFELVGFAYLFYGVLSIFITLLCNGMTLDIPPRFLFEYSKDGVDSHFALYSQGMSRHFGFCAVSVAYLLRKSCSISTSIVLNLFLVLFLSLSIIGGARGDSVASLVVVFTYLVLFQKFYKLGVVYVIGIASLIVLSEQHSLSDDLIIIRRLGAISDGDYGERDFLLSQVADVIINSSSLWFIGGGFGFFQKANNYDFGLYPHNVLAEAAVVYGVIPTIGLVVVVLRGVYLYFKQRTGLDLFILFYIYSLSVEMKSGYFFGGWFFTSASIIFFVIGSTGARGIIRPCFPDFKN
jgi:hypothetical protein